MQVVQRPLPFRAHSIISKIPDPSNMSTKAPSSVSKPVKSILKTKTTKRVKVSNQPVTKPTAKLVDPKPSAKSKGKQRETNPPAVSKERKPKPAKELHIRPPSSTFKVVVGSYEKLLYGLEGAISSSSTGAITVDLKPSFIFPAHVSCIKAVASSPNGGKWLATGSSDEIIKVWDLKRKKEIGGLMHHEGEFISMVCFSILTRR